VSGALNNGFRQFTLSLGTVGTQTLTVTDQSNGSIQGMTSAGIAVIPNAVHHFVIAPVSGPITAGQAVPVQIRATDATGNTIPNYNGDAILSANTGPQSIEPTAITFSNGQWNDNIVFKGAGGSVSFTCADFGSPPHTGTSNNFEVLPGPVAKLQVVPAGQTAQGGTPTGVSGCRASRRKPSPCRSAPSTPTGTGFLASTPHQVIEHGRPPMPPRRRRDGELLCRAPVAGFQTITATDVTNSNITEHTSSAIEVVGGPYGRIVILTSGQTLAPGTPTGQDPVVGAGQDINLPFTVRVQATDNWFNAVGGASDVIRITSTDPVAVAVVDGVEHPLPWDITLVDGQAELTVRVSSGGFQKMIATNVTQPTMPVSETQFEVAEYGFQLYAYVGDDEDPDVYQATNRFYLTVAVRNDQGAIREDYNQTVELRAVNASTGAAGRGRLTPTQVNVVTGVMTVQVQYSPSWSRSRCGTTTASWARRPCSP
jgi:hypothetical protein